MLEVLIKRMRPFFRLDAPARPAEACCGIGGCFVGGSRDRLLKSNSCDGRKLFSAPAPATSLAPPAPIISEKSSVGSSASVLSRKENKILCDLAVYIDLHCIVST